MKCWTSSINNDTDDKDIKSVVFAPGNERVEKGKTICASGNQGFIYISKKK